MSPSARATANLSRFLEREAGDYFRGLAVYDSEGPELVYVRDDLSERAVSNRVQELYEAVRPQRNLDSVDELGTPAATIQIREQAVILHFPLDDNHGYIVGLDPDAARDLHGFVTNCLQVIRRSLQ